MRPVDEKWYGIKVADASRDFVNLNTFIIFILPEHAALYFTLHFMVNDFMDYEKKSDGLNKRTLLDAKRLRPKTMEAFDNKSPRRQLSIALGPTLFRDILFMLQKELKINDFIDSCLLPKYIYADGEGDEWDLFHIPFVGTVSNGCHINWDVRPPTSYEDIRKLTI